MPLCHLKSAILFFIFFTISIRYFALKGRYCDSSDFDYFYTACDQNGQQRWRYALPKSTHMFCDNIPPPIPGLNCSFSCPAGTYLDISNQKCQMCPTGTFSLGDRIRYEEFSKFPSGFTVENFLDDNIFEQRNTHSSPDEYGEITDERLRECIGWVVKNRELRYLPSATSSCVSRLSISVLLVKNGFIEFHYKIPKNSRGLISLLQVRDAQCQLSNRFIKAIVNNKMAGKTHAEIHQDGSQRYSEKEWEVPSTKPGYRLHRMQLNAGQNTITWTVANNPILTTFTDVIHVAQIDISGLGFTSSCTKCPTGTYAPETGAQNCLTCRPGTYSKSRGSFECKECEEDEYSGIGSETCTRRSTCQSFDFYQQKESKCVNGSTTVKNKNVKPLVCKNGNLDLFEQTEKVDCPLCPLGMFRADDGACRRCTSPENEYVSPISGKCEKCQNGSIPEAGMFFNNWHFLPEEFSTDCEYIISDKISECDILPTWVPFGNRLESVQTRSTGVALELVLKVPKGFYHPFWVGSKRSEFKPTRENPIAKISFELETHCEDATCQFYLIQEGFSKTMNRKTAPETNVPFVIQMAINGSQPRKIWSLPILDSAPTVFVFIFTRSGAALASDAINDHAIIHSINISNVGDSVLQRSTFESASSAHRCIKCPKIEHGKCLPCPSGHSFDENECKICPHGTSLEINENGLSQCQACPEYMESSDDRSNCVFSGRFQLKIPTEHDRLLSFDISALRGTLLAVEGIRVFAPEGSANFHIFNVSFFEDSPVQCHDTFDALSFGFDNVQRASKKSLFNNDQSLFCRSAAISLETGVRRKNMTKFDTVNDTLGTLRQNNILYHSSVSLARKIAKITTSRNFQAFSLSDKLLEYESSLKSDTTHPIDVHFFFEPQQSVRPTASSFCPNGSIGAITLRCEPNAIQNPLVRLSRHCPDGTCDGCVYHVIVESFYGCPLCRPDDYKEIKGECINNEQKIHFIPSAHCVISGAQMHEQISQCFVVSQNVVVALLLAIFLIIMLTVVICVIYQRNKRLEYRYMRLIEEGGGKEHNQLNSCALSGSEEEDDDEDLNIVSTNTHMPRVFFGRKNRCSNVLPKSATRTKTDEETAGFFSDESS